MSAGRPSKYKTEYAARAKTLAEGGATIREIGMVLGTSERNISRWAAEFPEFRLALKLGRETADDRVEQSLYRRATGYSFDAVKILQHEGKPVIVDHVEHVPPCTTACIFWLKNRKPEEWRDIKAIEHDIGKRLEKLAERDLDNRLAELLRKAGAGPVAPGKTTAH